MMMNYQVWWDKLIIMSKIALNCIGWITVTGKDDDDDDDDDDESDKHL